MYAADNPAVNIALGKPADQISVSAYSRPGTMSDAEFLRLGFKPLVTVGAAPAAEAGSGFSLAHTQTVMEQARQLAARLKQAADRQQSAAAGGRAGANCRSTWRSWRRQPKLPRRLRRELYLQARSVKRRIAFCNPLLADIDKLLFIKRHDSGGVYHMCDQYYGCNARPGGGPVRAGESVRGAAAAGRPAGELGGRKRPAARAEARRRQLPVARALVRRADDPVRLQPGDGVDKNRGKETYQWAPECSYHIFRVNADGTGLVQLTDGDGDDFDPCFLPNGRIVFISERRGGYLRCGRHCPVYTMFSMRPTAATSSA